MNTSGVCCNHTTDTLPWYLVFLLELPGVDPELVPLKMGTVVPVSLVGSCPIF